MINQTSDTQNKEKTSLSKTRNRQEGIKTLINIALLFLILFTISWSLMKSLTFFTPDTGLRYTQIQELIKNNYSTLAISYWARDIDPGLEFTPFYYAYSVIDGEIFFQISSFMPLITARLFSLLGSLSLPIIPVIWANIEGITACFP